MLSRSAPVVVISNPRMAGKRTEAAKRVPILNIFPKKGKYKVIGNKIMLICPFHKEDTASFCIYTETNTYTCFAGCGSGDVIEFLQKLYNLSFHEALERLVK